MRGDTDSRGCTHIRCVIMVGSVMQKSHYHGAQQRRHIYHFTMQCAGVRVSAHTPRTRKTFLAAATEAWIFLALPGSPADMNMQVYCMATAS